jgi:uncharacterized protein
MGGRLVYFELPAQDTNRAQKFYEDLFGWKFQTWEGPVDYRMTEAGGDPGGALFESESGADGPRIYFDTDDVDGTAARIRELGGEAGEKQPVPGMGWYAQCKDSEGNTISLWQTDESASAPEG